MCSTPTILFLLPSENIQPILAEASKRKVKLVFMATTRDMKSNVQSVLHHWVRHDLERIVGLTTAESDDLHYVLQYSRGIAQSDLRLNNDLTTPLKRRVMCWHPKIFARFSH